MNKFTVLKLSLLNVNIVGETPFKKILVLKNSHVILFLSSFKVCRSSDVKIN